jgi:hypothetical protein
MKMIAQYLEKAIDFEKMALKEKDLRLKDSLLNLAAAYRKLADERARKLNLLVPPGRPKSS